MVSWVELVTKQFNASAAASEWFLGHMADDTWWPMQVFMQLALYFRKSLPVRGLSYTISQLISITMIDECSRH